MPSVIVIPTAEEQNKVANGLEPDASNILSREFDTSEELQSYIQGLESLADGVNYEVINDKGLTLAISFGGEETSITFNNDVQKAAYLTGLEDADGWMSPQKFEEGDEGYEALQAMLSARAPKP